MTAAHSPEAPALTRREILTVFAGLMAGMSLASLDGTAVNTAIATMVADLGGLSAYAWIGTAYLLTSTVSNALFGKLSDIYGRRPMFQAAIVTFIIGSIGCAVAQSMSVLVISRGVQGIGGGGLMSMAFVIIGDTVPPRERGRYVGMITSVFAVGSVVGPLIGGFFTEQLSWRWIFIVNIPIGVIALVVTSAALRIPFQKRDHAVDWLGSALLTASVTCLILLLSWSSEEYGWTSTLSMVLGISAVLIGITFVSWEKRAPEPVMPLHLFKIDVIRVTVPLVAFAGTIIYGANAFIPLFLQAVTGVSPTKSGLLLIPIMAGVTIASISTGRLTTRSGKYRHWPILGAVSLTVGMIFLSGMSDSGLGMASALTGMVFVGLGIGSIMPTCTLATQNAVDWKDLGVASAAITFFRTLGGVIGLAAFGAILNSRITGKVDKNLLQAPRKIKSIPDIELRERVLDVLGSGITFLYKIAIPVAIIVVLIAIRLPARPLRQTTGAPTVSTD
ncbi:MAG: MFS transporter [Actinobacteria bacterium]|nr:MFS transporter [Actinomycetota bacterium]NBP52895.1 MFS transporter [Actinomycetota bacterium]